MHTLNKLNKEYNIILNRELAINFTLYTQYFYNKLRIIRLINTSTLSPINILILLGIFNLILSLFLFLLLLVSYILKVLFLF